MEENEALDFYDNPQQEADMAPEVYVIDIAARPERRVCVYISKDDKNAGIGKN